jgi:hypothetical protein
MLALNLSKLHKLYQAGAKLMYYSTKYVIKIKNLPSEALISDLPSNHDISLFAVFKFVLTTENITQIKIAACMEKRLS